MSVQFFQDLIDIAAKVIKFLGITDYINGIEPKSLLLLAARKKFFLAKTGKLIVVPSVSY